MGGAVACKALQNSFTQNVLKSSMYHQQVFSVLVSSIWHVIDINMNTVAWQ